MNHIRNIIVISLLSLSNITRADISDFEITLSHKTTGYAQGYCSEGFILEKSIGNETIKLDIQLKFIGVEPGQEFIGNINSSLSGSRAGSSKKVYLESPDLCFKVKEVIIIKALGKINNKIIDLIDEDRIKQSDFVPYEIRVNKNG